MEKFTWATGVPTTRDAIKSSVGKGWRKIVDNLLNNLLKLGWNGKIAKESLTNRDFYG